MATLGTEGFVLGLKFVSDCSKWSWGVGLRKTYGRRWTVALVAVLDIVLHSLCNLLEQEGSLKS